MPFQSTVFQVLVAGPSDVSEERSIVYEELLEWTRSHLQAERVVLWPLHWETDSHPEVGGDPQSLLNQQIVDSCDAIIAVFGTRIGAATPRALSGTVEEIFRLVS